MEREILNIHCPNCGAPAAFDIKRQIYACSYCGGKVEIEDALAQRRELKEARQQKMKKTAKNFSLYTTSCTGCGATVVFEENEALSKCEFCGRSLVRKRYAYNNKAPESVIPFGVTKEEAKNKLLEWCDKNKSRSEAKAIRENINSLIGCYLPYEMINGPVSLDISVIKGSGAQKGSGYIRDGFVNCSKQFDNLLLDAMEPFDLDGLKEFDYGYVAGHRVKITDLDERQVGIRIRDEVSENYRSSMEKMWGTKALNIRPDTKSLMSQPVVLPAYYLAAEGIKAAVNGQTGKVSVLEEKESRYIALPWWLSGLAILLIACALIFSAGMLLTGNKVESLYYTGMAGFFFLIVFWAMFDDPSGNGGSIVRYHNIFTSGEQNFKRVKGKLVINDKVLKRTIDSPVFFRKIEGEERPVNYIFRSKRRMLSMVLTAFVVMFLPVICALLLNGFNLSRLELGGSAVWFCLAVPLVPIMLVRFGVQFIYDNPWIYILEEDGSRKRYHSSLIGEYGMFGSVKELIGMLFHPFSLIAIAVFCLMVYLTAFGF